MKTKEQKRKEAAARQAEHGTYITSTCRTCGSPIPIQKQGDYRREGISGAVLFTVPEPILTCPICRRDNKKMIEEIWNRKQKICKIWLEDRKKIRPYIPDIFECKGIEAAEELRQRVQTGLKVTYHEWERSARDELLLVLSFYKGEVCKHLDKECITCHRAELYTRWLKDPKNEGLIIILAGA